MSSSDSPEVAHDASRALHGQVQSTLYRYFCLNLDTVAE